MLVLIVLILVGVGLIALFVAVLRTHRSTREQKGQSGGDEREVYDAIYGKRSTTVSAGVPVERRPEPDADGPQTGLRE